MAQYGPKKHQSIKCLFTSLDSTISYIDRDKECTYVLGSVKLYVIIIDFGYLYSLHVFAMKFPIHKVSMLFTIFDLTLERLIGYFTPFQNLCYYEYFL